MAGVIGRSPKAIDEVRARVRVDWVLGVRHGKVELVVVGEIVRAIA